MGKKGKKRQDTEIERGSVYLSVGSLQAKLSSLVHPVHTGVHVPLSPDWTSSRFNSPADFLPDLEDVLSSTLI